MRYTIFKRGGYNLGTVGTTGGEVSGSVFLSRDPVAGNEAVTKNYLDVKFSSIPVSSFVTGNLPIGRLPEFSGDILKSDGSGETVAKTTSVSPGIYPKVTVNAKGLITAGGVLIETDVPELPWNKITAGKPTTVGGYGITNAMTTSGGTMLGALKVEEIDTAGNSLVNKLFVDGAGSSGSGISIGGIVYRNSAVTPTGYLRCNGGEVSKTTYAALYAVIGDQFGSELVPGSGQPWKQQYVLNVEQGGTIGAWSSGPAMPLGRSHGQAIVTANRAYFIGGLDGSDVYVNTVYTAPIDVNGNLGAWVAGPSLPGALGSSQAIVTKNRVYLLGGSSGGQFTSVNTVYTAPINADGTLGTWTTGTALPTDFGVSQAIVTKNRVYLLGGATDAAFINKVYTAPINADGTLGTWTTGTALPGTLGWSQAIVTKNRVYLLGGWTATGATTQTNTVYTAPINADGTLGTWTTSANLPAITSTAQAVVTKNKVYLIGGQNASGGITAVRICNINADGTLGTWTTGTALPAARYAACAIVTRTKIYLIGGSNGSSVIAGSYMTDFEGGQNNYSPFYDGNYLATTNNTTFRVPFVTAPPTDSYPYIKY